MFYNVYVCRCNGLWRGNFSGVSCVEKKKKNNKLNKNKNNALGPCRSSAIDLRPILPANYCLRLPRRVATPAHSLLRYTMPRTSSASGSGMLFSYFCFFLQFAVARVQVAPAVPRANCPTPSAPIYRSFDIRSETDEALLQPPTRKIDHWEASLFFLPPPLIELYERKLQMRRGKRKTRLGDYRSSTWAWVKTTVRSVFRVKKFTWTWGRKYFLVLFYFSLSQVIISRNLYYNNIVIGGAAIEICF